MGGRLLRSCLTCWAIAVLAPLAAHAQKSDLENDLKNIPKDSGSPVQPTPPEKSPTEPGTGPQRIQPPGTYINRFTGVPFPKKVGDFERLGVDVYDAEARDVGASYEKKRSGNLVNIITAYSFPVPPQLASGGARAVFSDAQLAITARQKDAKLIREGAYRAPDGSNGLLAEYEFSAGKSPTVRVRSRLYLFESNGWLLKLRVTYPLPRAREGGAEIEAFIRLFGAAVLRNPGGA
jgi:hypothetical protein